MGSDADSGSFYELRRFSSNDAFGSLTDIFGTRPEQTLGGATLGMARDTISKPENVQQKILRAQENDLSCVIAADTVAVIPKLKALPAGLTRATMLINPHQSARENAGAFSLNLAEGMALNHVGRSMLPDSRLQMTIAKNISGPLRRELATHLTVGAGFGFVKGTFDKNNWADEQGNFTPGKLVTNVTKSTAGGALINVPAGMIGVRAMKGSMTALAATEAPKRLSTTIAAAGSGYTSGSVFGGIDAIAHGKSFNETLAQMHFAGKVGLVTGGIMGGMDNNGALHARQRAIAETVFKSNSLPLQENLLATRLDKPASKATEPLSKPMEAARASKTPRDRLIFEELSSEQLALESRVKPDVSEGLSYKPVNDYRMADVSPRLTNPTREVEVVYKLKPEHQNKTFTSLEDFRAHTEPVEVPMVVYEVKGHKAQLVIEESLAIKMAKTQEARASAEKIAHKEIPFDKLSPQERMKISLELQTGNREEVLAKRFSPEEAKHSAEVLEARMKLIQEQKSGPVPEDFVLLLDESPNRNRIRRVVLSEHPNPEDPFNKGNLKDPKFESAATASLDGTITFYLTKNMAQDKATLRMFMGHEFGHLAAYAHPEEAALHHLAVIADRDVPNRNFRDVDRTAGGAASTMVASNSPKNVSARNSQPESGQKYPPAGPDKPTDKHFVREYARTNPDEDGAVSLGEEILAPDGDRLLAIAQAAPVRTLLQSRILTKEMAAAKVSGQSSHAPELRNRMRYVQSEVLPDAVRLLEKRVKAGSPSEQAASSELLAHFGEGDRHLPMLRKLAADPAARVVPADVPELVAAGAERPLSTAHSGKTGLVFEPTGTERTVADIAFDAMLKMKAGDVKGQLGFLAKEAHPDSPTREIALTRLGSARNDSAPHYLKFAKNSGDASKLPDLIELMRLMPDFEGKALVFQEALALGQHSPEFRKSLLARALETPGLGKRALEFVRPEEAALFEPQLKKLTRQSWDKPAQEQAEKLLAELSAGTDTGRVTQLLRSDNPKGVQQGLDIVISSKSADARLIEPLLEVAASAPEATSRAARQALLRFNSQLVKFYAQALKRRGSSPNPEVLQDIMTGR